MNTNKRRVRFMLFWQRANGEKIYRLDESGAIWKTESVQQARDTAWAELKTGNIYRIEETWNA